MWWRRRSSARPHTAPEAVGQVCGWGDGDAFYDETGAPTYLICDCCGGESGADDHDLRAARRYRAKWSSEGSPWFNPKARPSSWDPDAQFGNVTEGYR